MDRKPRILLIPNVAWWIIGEMGKQIIERFGDKYDFYFVTEDVLERRPELFQTLLRSVDAVHCLNESSIELFRNIDPKTLPPTATWIHHVTSWSPHHQMAVDLSSALTVCTPEWKQYLDSRVEGQIPVTIVRHGVDTKFFHKRTVSQGRFGIPEDVLCSDLSATKAVIPMAAERAWMSSRHRPQGCRSLATPACDDDRPRMEEEVVGTPLQGISAALLVTFARWIFRSCILRWTYTC